jgi:cysteine desulfurase/selenocysteine lyase
VGLGEAARYAMKWGVDAIWERTQYLGACLREKLKLIPGIHLHDKGQILCGIVTFTHEKMSTPTLYKTLRAAGMNTSISRSAYALLDMEARGLSEILRASVHYYNTEEEIDRFCEQVQ